MALLGSFFAGSSMVLQKVGVRKSRKSWWLGILCLILGEVLTVVAYTNAPAVLVSPLGAMRVIVTTLLSVKYLREEIQDSTKKLFSKFHNLGWIIMLHL
jgi:drug/metabolite transporter (DMT)-like permease